MQSTMLMLMAVATLAGAGYAHIRVSGLTASRHRAWVVRGVLVVVGIGFGWTALAVVFTQEASAAMQAVIFLAAFGLVHVPAAIILLLKTWQRSGS